MNAERRTLTALVVVIALLGSGQSLAQGKASVGIPDFKNKAGIDRHIGSALVDMITTQLVKARKFRVVERTQLGAIADEQALGASGAVASESAARTGQIAGADYILLGVVTEAGVSNQRTRVGGIQTAKGSLLLSIDIRFIDSETSEVVFADTVTRTRSSFKWGSRHAYFDMHSGDTAALAREVVNAVTRKVMVSVYPPKVIDASNLRQVMINYGDALFTPGEVWNVFSLGMELKDPDTGEVLGNTESQIGQVRIVSTTDKMSSALCIDGTAEAGAVLRFSSGAPVPQRKKKVDPF